MGNIENEHMSERNIPAELMAFSGILQTYPKQQICIVGELQNTKFTGHANGILNEAEENELKQSIGNCDDSRYPYNLNDSLYIRASHIETPSMTLLSMICGSSQNWTFELMTSDSKKMAPEVRYRYRNGIPKECDDPAALEVILTAKKIFLNRMLRRGVIEFDVA